MPHSMTAFSRVQNQLDSAMICWELKSVNHRYLEAGFRMPESLRYLEPVLRNTLRQKINRGKIECQLKVDRTLSAQQSIQIDKELIRTLLFAGQELSEQHALANDLTVSQVMSWPGVVALREPAWEALGDKVEQLFLNAVDQLASARYNEGEELKTFIESRVELVSIEVNNVRKLTETASIRAREKLMTRIENLQLAVTEGRLEQEIALLLTRLDVSEELDRLQTHLNEVSRVLGEDKPIGRRLDFLMQELNREANTLGSKSDSAVLTQHTVEMKVLIEQMREQIQNIE